MVAFKDATSETLFLGQKHCDPGEPRRIVQVVVLAGLNIRCLVAVVADSNRYRTSHQAFSMAQELAVLTSTTKLTSWMLGKLEKLPRSHRYGLGLRMETKCYEIIEHLIEAKFSPEKDEPLREAALKVEQLRYLARLCVERRLLALKNHEFLIRELDAIGKAVGAWRKYTAARDLTESKRR
ncbi:MAG: four helix bundle protein [Planctomycetota bacterium]